jgi:hypothetical protein
MPCWSLNAYQITAVVATSVIRRARCSRLASCDTCRLLIHNHLLLFRLLIFLTVRLTAYAEIETEEPLLRLRILPGLILFPVGLCQTTRTVDLLSFLEWSSTFFSNLYSHSYLLVVAEFHIVITTCFATRSAFVLSFSRGVHFYSS